MNKAKGIVLLVLTAAIWGFAFVAQRVGNRYLDPLLFNALRFAIGAVCVGLIGVWNKSLSRRISSAGAILGVILFVASSLQQYGLVWTSAGAGGFITGLYIVFVPIFGILRGQIFRKRIALALAVSIVGLGLINDFADMSLSMGNLLVFCSSIFWAMHVQMIDKYRQFGSTIDLAFAQYTVAALLSTLASVFSNGFKPQIAVDSMTVLNGICAALPAILYGGIFSVGIAFSLQAYAQRTVKPTVAALILCSEGIFALVGGWIILGEGLTLKASMGALLMLIATVMALRD